jgi:hypothetical protein
LRVRIRDARGELVALVTGSRTQPRLWPMSRYSQVVTLGALPLVARDDRDAQRHALWTIEPALAREGVYRICVASFDSPHAATVLNACGYSLTPRVEFYLDLDRSEDELFANLVGVRRNDIRRAERAGVTTELRTELTAFQSLIQFELASLARRGLSPEIDVNTQATFLRNTLGKSKTSRLFVTSHGGEPVNAALFGVFGTRAYYLYSGSTERGNRCAGPAHLLWTAITHFLRTGVTAFNLGGVKTPTGENDPNYGLFRFKRNFGTVTIDQPGGDKIIAQTGAVLARGTEAVRRLHSRLR